MQSLITAALGIACMACAMFGAFGIGIMIEKSTKGNPGLDLNEKERTAVLFWTFVASGFAVLSVALLLVRSA